MALSDGTGMIANAFQQTEILGLGTLIHATIIIISLVAITRNTEKWGQLALPVAIAWTIAGIPTNIIILIPLIIISVIDALGVKMGINMLKASTYKPEITIPKTNKEKQTGENRLIEIIKPSTFKRRKL